MLEFTSFRTTSKTAKKGNAENLLIITDYPELIQQYVKNWEARMSQSYKYAPN